MTTDPRFCVACHAPIPPGSEVCGNCGAYQYAPSGKSPLPHLQYNVPLQPPTGMRADVALQVAPGQYVLIMPQASAVMPLARPRTSGFAIASMALGIPATILALLDFLLDARQVISPPYIGNTGLLLLFIILACICWTPALLAFIFGLLAQRQIHRNEGHIQGLGMAYTGVALGSIGLALPLAGILLFALTFLVV